MIISDADSETRLSGLWLGLTEAEARELRDTLTTLLNDPKRRHEHVSSADYQTEMTVWIERTPAA